MWGLDLPMLRPVRLGCEMLKATREDAWKTGAAAGELGISGSTMHFSNVVESSRSRS